MTTGSRIVRWGPGRWPELAVRRYRESEEGSAVTRRLLVGAEDSGLSAELRFFEVAAGETTRFERHEHAHAVVVLAGRGQVQLVEALHPVEPFDLVYVAPHTPHRFLAAADEPLGFLCLVDSERDRPEELDAHGVEPRPTESPR